jgi:hypothetical protein
MSLLLINEVWDVLKPIIHPTDLKEAGDNLVTFLVENEYDPVEIKKVFKRDSIIVSAVNYYLESPGDEFSDKEDDDSDEDDDGIDDDYENEWI